MANVTIYTDGAAKGNPGRGGYGVVRSTTPNVSVDGMDTCFLHDRRTSQCRTHWP